jgi:hypothetical protein
MVNIEINLAVSGVTTIPIANTETEVILHVWYDGNDTFYHNIHRVFLENENDILTCQVWFQQIGQVETEAELLLQDAIRVINIAPNSKKTLIIVAVDKTKIGGERFFADTVSGNSEIDTSSFVTQDSLNQTVSQIYDDLSLTAERIVQNATNPDTSTSAIELTNDRASFFVQTNTVDFIVNEVYADWDLALQPLALIDNVGTLTASQIASLFADYPRPEYQLYPFHDLNLTNLSFYVMRNMEAYWLNVTEFELSAYRDRFGLILDTSILGSEFVKIQLTNLNIISGSPNANNATFPLMVVGTTARPTVKYPYGTFKIWKNDNTTRDNIIFSVPLTNARVQSTKTTNNLDTLNFWINNEGWYFGTKTERNELFSPITKSYDADIGTANITLEDGMDNTIVPISFARMNPSFGSTLPSGNGLLSFNNGNLVEEINFKLRLVVSGVPFGTPITIRQNTTPIFTYLTVNTDTAQPNVVTLLVRANNALIAIVPVIEIKDQDYHDWAFVSGNSALSVAQIMKTPAKVLTTAQYNAFNPNSPIILNVSANDKAPITLNNLSFYTLRNNFDVYTNSGTFVYNTGTYANRLNINIDTTSLSSTEWVPLNLINLYYKQGAPIANNKMFPASTSSTTNYTKLYPSTNFRGKINIGNINNSYFSLPVGESGGSDNALINAKFRIKKDGINTKLYQGLESESSNIIFSEPNTIPLDLSYQEKIFYPTFSNSYNWVTYSRYFQITAPYSAAPIGTNIYQFFLRLYCVYGSTLSTINRTGMTYVPSINSFEGRPTNSNTFINYNFTLALSHQVSSSFFLTSYQIPYPSFPMNDLRVVDLIFEVNQNFFNANNVVDAKKKLKYLGQRIIKL